MVLTDKKYPQKLALFYLDDIRKAFLEMIHRHYGQENIDINSKIEIIDESYYFIKFGKAFIQIE